MAFGNGWIVRFDLIEITELVQALNAKFPSLFVIKLAFFEDQFAADDFVTSGCVALKLDAANRELLAFVDFDLPRNEFFLLIKSGRGNRGVVDEALSSIDAL